MENKLTQLTTEEKQLIIRWLKIITGNFTSSMTLSGQEIPAKKLAKWVEES